MHKVVVSSFLGALLLCGMDVFGQFSKEVQKAAKNLTNLEQALDLAAAEAVVNAPALTRLSPVTIENHVTGVLRVALPQSITHSAQLNELLRDHPSVAYGIPETLSTLLAKEWEKQTGNRWFYRDQSALAQDLDALYGENAPVLVGPGQRKVKLYILPVNGIWYKPIGYTTPVVLNADDYFVIYDTQSKTGKIADNNPEVYNMFKPQVYDLIWKAMRADKVFDDLGNLCDTILMAHLHKARLEQQGVSIDIKNVAKQNRSAVWQQLNTPETLLNYVKQFPRVRQIQSGFRAYVVELPVEGLVWVDPSGTRHTYNPKEHVMLFFEMGTSGIYPRADVENPKLFDKLPLAKQFATDEKTAIFVEHPHNDLWNFYHRQKTYWMHDRQMDLFESLWDLTYPRTFESQAQLGQALDSFYRQMSVRVREKETGISGYVYEIPVKGLTCPFNGITPRTIDPVQYVFVYDARTGGHLVKRNELENAARYEFVR